MPTLLSGQAPDYSQLHGCSDAYLLVGTAGKRLPSVADACSAGMEEESSEAEEAERATKRARAAAQRRIIQPGSAILKVHARALHSAWCA